MSANFVPVSGPASSRCDEPFGLPKAITFPEDQAPRTEYDSDSCTGDFVAVGEGEADVLEDRCQVEGDGYEVCDQVWSWLGAPCVNVIFVVADPQRSRFWSCRRCLKVSRCSTAISLASESARPKGTSHLFARYRGEWALISFFVVLSPTIGQVSLSCTSVVVAFREAH